MHGVHRLVIKNRNSIFDGNLEEKKLSKFVKQDQNHHNHKKSEQILENLDTGLSRSEGPRRNIMARLAGRFVGLPEIIVVIGTVRVPIGQQL